MHQLNRVHKIGNVVSSVVVVLQQDRAIYDEGEESFIKSHRELPAMNPLETWPCGNTAENDNPGDPFKGPLKALQFQRGSRLVLAIGTAAP